MYLDYQSAKPVDPEVIAAMTPYMVEKFGNASSLHEVGDWSTEALDSSRRMIAHFVNAREPEEIIFTSGATEANNLAIIGYALRNKQKGKHVIISEVEHISILNIAKYLRKNGFEVSTVPVDYTGTVRLDKLEERIRPDTILISIQHFKNSRNVGTLEGKGVAVGRVGNPVCGDLMDIYIKVDDDGKIEDIKFKTFGCGSAVATSSMITEIAKGKTLDEAMKISRQDVADELEGLPPIKMHCSNLAADALHEAIKNFREGKKGPIELGETRFACPAGEVKNVIGLAEFVGKGVFTGYEHPEQFRDKRVLVVEFDQNSVEFALELTKVTGRVILLSPLEQLAVNEELKTQVKRSDIKHLTQAELVEVSGGSEVEKVRIHDLDEDEEYDLVVDAVIVPA